MLNWIRDENYMLSSFAYSRDASYTRVWMTEVMKLPGHGPTPALFFLFCESSMIRLCVGKKMNRNGVTDWHEESEKCLGFGSKIESTIEFLPGYRKTRDLCGRGLPRLMEKGLLQHLQKILNTHLFSLTLPTSPFPQLSSATPINCPCALTCFVLAYLAPVALPNPLRTTPPETCVPSPNQSSPTTHHPPCLLL